MGIADIVRKSEQLMNKVGTKRSAEAGWKPSITGYYGYGDEGMIRVLARVLMRDPDEERMDNEATANSSLSTKAQRGFRQFFTIQVGGHPVTVRAGNAVVEAHSNENGYVEVQVKDHGLEPGWQKVTIEAQDAEPVEAEVFIIEPGTKIGLVSDIDDTIMVTWLPRALLAAYNSWVLRTNARKPVPGMSSFYAELLKRHPNAPVFYLSTGAWNTYDSLVDFIGKHLLPKGPMLLTDWGPTPTGLFRSGQEHKKVQLRNLIIDFPNIKWILVGDDGQHDPLIYGNIAAEHPDRIAGIGIRQLTPGEHVLSHGSAIPIDDPETTGHAEAPYVLGKDGFELLKEYLKNPFPRERKLADVEDAQGVNG
ncbi:App1 family protein [Corynebacterium sp. H78]|uniref:App1 family protein n=1 Tax=Corynebacterium sp. H78 TaxID=3133417 RepID=UPI0030B07264